MYETRLKEEVEDNVKKKKGPQVRKKNMMQRLQNFLKNNTGVKKKIVFAKPLFVRFHISTAKYCT